MTDAVGIRVQLPPGRLVLGISCVLSTRFLLTILCEIVVFRQFPRAFRATTRDLFLFGV